MDNIKPMKCKKCGGYLFYIDNLTECEGCKFNGAHHEVTGYIYDQAEIERLDIPRDQAENEGECGLGTSYNQGCHLYTCAKCKTNINWPCIYD